MTPVRAWRVTRSRFARPPYDPFDGAGAKQHGGRWNNKGVAVVYASGSLSLAVLEILVHADDLSALGDHVHFPIDIPADLIHELAPGELPADWRNPMSPVTLRDLGDAWVASGRTAALRVPSAVIPDEVNYVLNPLHPEYARVMRGDPYPLPIDPRLLRR